MIDINSKERKKISEYIENNHTGIEKLDAVATDKNNVSKKKANTLLIKYGKIIIRPKKKS